jgi:RNA polymerase sigma factor (sigma-70 family)
VHPSLRARIRAGDPAAFGDLFDSHAGAVHRYAVRALGGWSNAEDVVSLTFAEAWRLRGSLRPDGDSVLPWLLGIATNVLRNTRRAARRHRAALARIPARDAVPDFAEELVDRLHHVDQLAAAAAALRRLHPADRAVFALVVWSGLDYAAAAEALGVPVGTVRSRLSRARDRLRKLAGEELRRPGSEPGRRDGQDMDSRTVAHRPNQEENR